MAFSIPDPFFCLDMAIGGKLAAATLSLWIALIERPVRIAMDLVSLPSLINVKMELFSPIYTFLGPIRMNIKDVKAKS